MSSGIEKTLPSYRDEEDSGNWTLLINNFENYINLVSSKKDSINKYEYNMFNSILESMYNTNYKDQKQIENIACKNSMFSYRYVLNLNREGKEPLNKVRVETCISKNAYSSYKYAQRILEGRFPEGEPVITKDLYYRSLYLELIKDPKILGT